MLRFFIFCLLLCWPFLQLWAWQQPPATPGLRHFTTEDGLPSSEVYDIIQDRQGFIWISTDNGICRFDGYRFTHFGKAEGLTDPTVFHLVEDHRGWIWMATFRRNIFILKEGKITTFPHSAALRKILESFSPASFNWISVTKDGTLWLSIPYYGVIRISEQGEITNYNQDTTPRWVMVTLEQQVHFICQNKQKQPFPQPHQMLLSTFQDTIKRVIPWENTKDYSRILYNNCFTQPANERILFQTPKELLFINPTALAVERRRPYPYGSILSYLESKHTDRIYVGHWKTGKGLRIFSNREALENPSSDGMPDFILPNKTISHLLEDRQGGIWIATDSDGIYYISQPELFFASTRSADLQGVVSITLQSPDSCFAGTKNKEIFSIDQHLTVRPIPSAASDYINDQIFYDTLQNRLYSTGALRYLKNGRWYDVPKNKMLPWPIGTSRFFSNAIIPAAHQAEQLYFLGNFFIYSATRDREAYHFEPAIILQPQQRIFDIHQDIDGRLFVGGMEGLYQFDTSQQAFIRQEHHPAFLNRIQMLAEYGPGTLIIGTRDDGLYLWKGEQVRHISTKDRLSSAYIKTIHVDSLQTIWVGTNNGLNRITIDDQDSVNIRTFSVADGLPSNEINDIASWGRQVWIATVNGVVKLPIDLAAPPAPMQPQIAGFEVNGKAIDPASSPTFGWRENNILIDLLAFDYAQGDRIVYRYRFRPEALWQETKSPTISIPYLSSGKYAFEVQAKGIDNNWSPSSTLQFTIRQPFWTTLWFWGICFVLAILTFTLIQRQRLRNRERQRQQDQQVTRLEQQIEDLRQQAYQAQMNPHFIFNCLTAIQSFILQDDHNKLMASDYLSKFARLIRQALNASRSKSITLEEDRKMLENYIELERFRFAQRFDYTLTMDPKLDPYHIKIPPMLIQPYVENAIIHGFADINYPGKLTVHYQKDAEYLLVTIEDNGIGFHQSRQRSDKHRHRPAGMEITEKRLRIETLSSDVPAVRIHETYQNGKVGGTKVAVRIPLSVGKKTV
jgi:signal transduction histidine kinase